MIGSILHFDVFEIAATDESDRVLFRRRFSRSRFREFLAKLDGGTDPTHQYPARPPAGVWNLHTPRCKHVSPRIGALLQSGGEIPDALLPLLAEARTEIEAIEQRIKETERQLKAIAREDDTVRRLMTIPGVGLLSATAIVAFVGDLSRFTSGRHFAAYLGITPRERSSGDRRRLGGISKRGNSYLRKLLIHGGRSALRAGKRVERPDGLRAWAIRLEARSCHNAATVALANKIARIAWAVGTRSSVYDRNLFAS